jgi:hypothetical protein
MWSIDLQCFIVRGE